MKFEVIELDKQYAFEDQVITFDQIKLYILNII